VISDFAASASENSPQTAKYPASQEPAGKYSSKSIPAFEKYKKQKFP